MKISIGDVLMESNLGISGFLVNKGTSSFGLGTVALADYKALWEN